MNLHNYKQQSAVGKAALILTFPFAIGIHLGEWLRERKLKRMIRKWLPVAIKKPNGHEAKMVKEWSSELRYIYGK